MNYVIQDLGLGDSGKGATVDYICSREQIDLVVRFNGGFQAAHNVVLADGRHHCFSQFGSGTLRNVPTFLDSHVITDPLALLAEANHLEDLGIENPLGLVQVYPDCLISTIYHKLLNRVQDRRSGHGSCGVGIGATRSMWSKTGDGLRFSDLYSKRVTKRKLDWIRQWCQDQLVDYESVTPSLHDINIHWGGNKVNAYDEAALLCGSISSILTSEFVPRSNNVIFEGAQGYRLDEVFGTIPHTTYSNTRPTYALEFCEYYGLEKPKIYGIIRAYETRHGNGPMWREDPTHVDISKDHNKGGFAGQFRVGELNKSAVREAYNHCECDAMIINCMDHVNQATENDLHEEFLPEIVSYGPTAEDRRRIR